VLRSQEFPYGWRVGTPPYAKWGDVGVNGGLPDGGEPFSLVRTGKPVWLAFNNDIRWLVCEWWFGEPQLFKLVDYMNPPGEEEIPKGCAIVNLVVEWI
jgi:hypothetical protein